MGDLSEGTSEISNDDLYAIDVYYGFDKHDGYPRRESWMGPGQYMQLPRGPKKEQERIEFMDRKDSLAKQNEKEGLPFKTALLGFGAAAVMLTPFGWVLASGVGAVWGGKKLYKEWSKARTVKAYGRTFALNSKGVVIFHINADGIKRHVFPVPVL